MANYKIFFKKSVKKELYVLSKTDLQPVIKRIEKLAENPRPLDSEKLSGQEKYRIRQGDYRIIYSIHDYELHIWIVKIAHRKLVYRNL